MKRFFDYMARAPMLPAGSRQFGHTFCWYSLILWLPLHDDRIAAPFRVPMGKTVQTIASSASDRGIGEVLFPSYGEARPRSGSTVFLSYSVSQMMSPRNARRLTVFVGAAGFLSNLSLMHDLPLQCEH